MNACFYQHVESPIGVLEVCASEAALHSIFFVDEPNPVNTNSITESAVKQLCDYFDGHRKAFDLPMVTQGTAFQQQVWARLQTIPYGQTCSYADIAAQIDNPKAVRAVGAANGKNPLSIVVPCHRVIAASGKLSGYAGGVDRKAWLLAHEFELGVSS